MNINEFRNAYDGVRATASLKKRVMDAAKAEADDSDRRKFRPVRYIGIAVGTAALIVLTFIGAGAIRSLFADRGIVVTVDERPELNDSAFSAPHLTEISGLYSPKETASHIWAEQMPVLNEEDEHLGKGFFTPFIPEFTAFGDTLKEEAGTDAFDDWYSQFTSEPPFHTFYNSPNLLSYLIYFEIDSDTAQKLLTYANEKDNLNLSDDMISALADRDEDLCRYLFVTDDIAKITYTEDYGYTFFTWYDLYKMPIYELASRLEDAGDIQATCLLDLRLKFTDEAYRSAVERKYLLVKSILRLNSMPTPEKDAKEYWFSGFYEQKVCDFSQPLYINGEEIFNYVYDLIVQKSAETDDPDTTLYYTINGFPSEPNYGTIPSYRKLLDSKNIKITPDELYEAIALMNSHYYNITGDYLYTDEEIRVICSGTKEEFTDMFINPYVFVSTKNNLGGTLWITPDHIYKTSVYYLLEYSELTEDYLYSIYEKMSDSISNGIVKEYFLENIEIFRRVRRLSAMNFIKEDSERIVIPTLSREMVAEFNKINTDSQELTYTEFYYMTLEQMLHHGYTSEFVRSMTDALLETEKSGCSFTFHEKESLILKKYLYIWYTSDINLYNEEYIGALLDATNYTYEIGDNELYIDYPVKSAKENMIKTLKEWHIDNISDVPLSDKASEKTDETYFRLISDVSQEIIPVSECPILEGERDDTYTICAGIGYDKWTRNPHYGIDYAVNYDTRIAALDEGTVVFAGDNGNYGNTVIIEHENGVNTFYAHCADIFCKEKQEVEKGFIIATVGSTGNCTGPHLHFEVLIDDKNIDPSAYMNNGEIIYI